MSLQSRGLQRCDVASDDDGDDDEYDDDIDMYMILEGG